MPSDDRRWWDVNRFTGDVLVGRVAVMVVIRLIHMIFVSVRCALHRAGTGRVGLLLLLMMVLSVFRGHGIGRSLVENGLRYFDDGLDVQNFAIVGYIRRRCALLTGWFVRGEIFYDRRKRKQS